MAQELRIAEVQEVETPKPGTWKLDAHHTTVEFVARHMLTKVRGRFAEFDGSIKIAEKPEESSVNVTIAAPSIDSGSEMRDGHLKSADFLDVEKFPVLSFKSTKVDVVDDEHLRVTGDLTIRDVTKPITLDVEYLGQSESPTGSTAAAFSASADFERENWGVNWNVALETGGFLVSKNVRIEIETELVPAES